MTEERLKEIEDEYSVLPRSAVVRQNLERPKSVIWELIAEVRRLRVELDDFRTMAQRHGSALSHGRGT